MRRDQKDTRQSEIERSLNREQRVIPDLKIVISVARSIQNLSTEAGFLLASGETLNTTTATRRKIPDQVDLRKNLRTQRNGDISTQNSRWKVSFAGS